MFSPRAVVTILLLVSTNLTGFASAYPTDDISSREVGYVEPITIPLDIEAQLQTRKPETEGFGLPEDQMLQTRALSIRIAPGKPSASANCPATYNGPGRNYQARVYTVNQITAAMTAGAQLLANNKQTGAQKYPHDFMNLERLRFACGKSKQEFPIQPDNRVYNGGSVNDVPDRVIFEYKKTKTDLLITYCGVIRHGPRTDFLNC
ncbi:uncharacterized protein BP5553_02819 [Venustampulla echinocandica]|uniref:ribonuclease T1 n=1 Tax=Venustampulla echinocandica TaxID=2656787 RepID=A0A370TSG5_9HELO|nr:uncharacterized protein BP5553_02819 [Venustampulla echinocandica]RDL38479.1 hypothetical protein BP5553_02819 [Venustampulla echinocandica]